MKRRLECIVSGRVQGINFRDFVCRRAHTLGLTGNVRNQNDGSLLVIAEGDEKALRRMLPYLERGPLFAKVASVERVWKEYQGAFASFIKEQ